MKYVVFSYLFFAERERESNIACVSCFNAYIILVNLQGIECPIVMW